MFLWAIDINMKIAYLLVAISACFLQPVYAQNNLFEIKLPATYCEIDRSVKKDAFFDEYIRKIAGHSLSIKSLALPCSELQTYRASPLHLPKKFIAWAQVGVDGSFSRFLLGKSVYSAMIMTFSPEKNLKKIEKRTSEKISNYGDRIENLQAGILGEKNGIVFIAGKAKVIQEGGTQALGLSAATTLVEKYPWAVMYGNTDAEKAGESELSSWLRSIYKK